jgi:hypothetical protein
MLSHNNSWYMLSVQYVGIIPYWTYVIPNSMVHDHFPSSVCSLGLYHIYIYPMFRQTHIDLKSRDIDNLMLIYLNYVSTLLQKKPKKSEGFGCPEANQNPNPIGSMYAIYGNIYHQYTPNVSIYTIHGSYGNVAQSFLLGDFQHLSTFSRPHLREVVGLLKAGALAAKRNHYPAW